MHTVAEIDIVQSGLSDTGEISTAERRNTLAASYLGAFLTLSLLLRYCALSTTIGVMTVVNMILVSITLHVLRKANSEAKILAWTFLGCFDFLVLIGLFCPQCVR